MISAMTIKESLVRTAREIFICLQRLLMKREEEGGKGVAAAASGRGVKWFYLHGSLFHQVVVLN